MLFLKFILYIVKIIGKRMGAIVSLCFPSKKKAYDENDLESNINPSRRNSSIRRPSPNKKDNNPKTRKPPRVTNSQDREQDISDEEMARRFYPSSEPSKSSEKNISKSKPSFINNQVNKETRKSFFQIDHTIKPQTFLSHTAQKALGNQSPRSVSRDYSSANKTNISQQGFQASSSKEKTLFPNGYFSSTIKNQNDTVKNTDDGVPQATKLLVKTLGDNIDQHDFKSDKHQLQYVTPTQDSNKQIEKPRHATEITNSGIHQTHFDVNINTNMHRTKPELHIKHSGKLSETMSNYGSTVRPVNSNQQYSRTQSELQTNYVSGQQLRRDHGISQQNQKQVSELPSNTIAISERNSTNATLVNTKHAYFKADSKTLPVPIPRNSKSIENDNNDIRGIKGMFTEGKEEEFNTTLLNNSCSTGSPQQSKLVKAKLIIENKNTLHFIPHMPIKENCTPVESVRPKSSFKDFTKPIAANHKSVINAKLSSDFEDEPLSIHSNKPGINEENIITKNKIFNINEHNFPPLGNLPNKKFLAPTKDCQYVSYEGKTSENVSNIQIPSNDFEQSNKNTLRNNDNPYAQVPTKFTNSSNNDSITKSNMMCKGQIEESIPQPVFSEKNAASNIIGYAPTHPNYEVITQIGNSNQGIEAVKRGNIIKMEIPGNDTKGMFPEKLEELERQIDNNSTSQSTQYSCKQINKENIARVDENKCVALDNQCSKKLSATVLDNNVLPTIDTPILNSPHALIEGMQKILEPENKDKMPNLAYNNTDLLIGKESKPQSVVAEKEDMYDNSNNKPKYAMESNNVIDEEKIQNRCLNEMQHDKNYLFLNELSETKVITNKGISDEKSNLASFLNENKYYTLEVENFIKIEDDAGLFPQNEKLNQPSSIALKGEEKSDNNKRKAMHIPISYNLVELDHDEQTFIDASTVTKMSNFYDKTFLCHSNQDQCQSLDAESVKIESNNSDSLRNQNSEQQSIGSFDQQAKDGNISTHDYKQFNTALDDIKTAEYIKNDELKYIEANQTEVITNKEITEEESNLISRDTDSFLNKNQCHTSEADSFITKDDNESHLPQNKNVNQLKSSMTLKREDIYDNNKQEEMYIPISYNLLELDHDEQTSIDALIVTKMSNFDDNSCLSHFNQDQCQSLDTGSVKIEYNNSDLLSNQNWEQQSIGLLDQQVKEGNVSTHDYKQFNIALDDTKNAEYIKNDGINDELKYNKPNDTEITIIKEITEEESNLTSKDTDSFLNKNQCHTSEADTFRTIDDNASYLSQNQNINQLKSSMTSKRKESYDNNRQDEMHIPISNNLLELDHDKQTSTDATLVTKMSKFVDKAYLSYFNQDQCQSSDTGSVKIESNNSDSLLNQNSEEQSIGSLNQQEIEGNLSTHDYKQSNAALKDAKNPGRINNDEIDDDPKYNENIKDIMFNLEHTQSTATLNLMTHNEITENLNNQFGFTKVNDVSYTEQNEEIKGDVLTYEHEYTYSIAHLHEKENIDKYENINISEESNNQFGIKSETTQLNQDQNNGILIDVPVQDYKQSVVMLDQNDSPKKFMKGNVHKDLNNTFTNDNNLWETELNTEILSDNSTHDEQYKPRTNQTEPEIQVNDANFNKDISPNYVPVPRETMNSQSFNSDPNYTNEDFINKTAAEDVLVNQNTALLVHKRTLDESLANNSSAESNLQYSENNELLSYLVSGEEAFKNHKSDLGGENRNDSAKRLKLAVHDISNLDDYNKMEIQDFESIGYSTANKDSIKIEIEQTDRLRDDKTTNKKSNTALPEALIDNREVPHTKLLEKSTENLEEINYIPSDNIQSTHSIPNLTLERDPLSVSNIPCNQAIVLENTLNDQIDQKVYEKVINSLEEIRQKALPFEEEILNFIELEDSNKYYYIEESLRRLIDKLDDMYDDIGENRMLRDARKQVYKFIFPLFDMLDAKIEENKDLIEKQHNNRS